MCMKSFFLCRLRLLKTVYNLFQSCLLRKEPGCCKIKREVGRDSAGPQCLGQLQSQWLAPDSLILQSGEKSFRGPTVLMKLEKLCVTYTEGVQLLSLCGGKARFSQWLDESCRSLANPLGQLNLGRSNREVTQTSS